MNSSVLSSAPGSPSLRTIPSQSQEWGDLNCREVSVSSICLGSVSGSVQPSRQSSSPSEERRRSLRVELLSSFRS